MSAILILAEPIGSKKELFQLLLEKGLKLASNRDFQDDFHALVHRENGCIVIFTPRFTMTAVNPDDTGKSYVGRFHTSACSPVLCEGGTPLPQGQAILVK